MKKIFLLIVLLTSFRSANAQLPFYEFGFNIYENNTRIVDQNKFKVFYYSTKRENGEVFTFPEVKPSNDTSKTYGYDYLFVEGGPMLRNYIVNVLVIKESRDTMNIEFNYPGSGPWEMLGIDKLIYSPGNFKLTGYEWPNNRRDRYKNNRYFPFLDESFDWESIRK